MSAKWHRFEVESFSYDSIKNWYLSVDHSTLVKHDVLVFVVNREGIEIVYFSVWHPSSLLTLHRELGGTLSLSRAVTDQYKDVFAYFDKAFAYLAKTYRCCFRLNVAPTDRGLWKIYPNIDQRPLSYACLMNNRLAIVDCIPIMHEKQVDILRTWKGYISTEEEINACVEKKLEPTATIIGTLSSDSLYSEVPTDIAYQYIWFPEYINFHVKSKLKPETTHTCLFSCAVSDAPRLIDHLRKSQNFLELFALPIYDKKAVFQHRDNDVSVCWVSTTMFRLPYLTDAVTLAVLGLWTVATKYALLDIVSRLPNMQYMNRKHLDSLLDSILLSITNIVKRKTGPHSNTRQKQKLIK